jgi:hypothetical protein
VAAVVVIAFHFVKAPDLRWIARKIEKHHPELNGILLTAVQQQLDPGTQPGYLQYRVLQEATARSQEQDWRDVVSTGRLMMVHGVHLVALICFLFAAANLRVVSIHGEAPHWVGSDGIALGIDRFGASAPYKEIYEHLGLTVAKIVESAKSLLGKG